MQSCKFMIQEVSMRKCLVTGISFDKKELMRFVVDPKDKLIADLDHILPGRGYWVKTDRQVILKALQKNIFFKAVKKKISVDINLISSIEFQIKQKIIQQISMSRKAGKAIFGFEKIKSLSFANTIKLLIQATDGSEKEKKRLLTKSIPNIIDNCLTGSELGKPFAREKVIHCAVLESGLSEKIIFNANRLNNLKNPVPHYSDVKMPVKNKRYY